MGLRTHAPCRTAGGDGRSKDRKDQWSESNAGVFVRAGISVAQTAPGKTMAATTKLTTRVSKVILLQIQTLGSV